MNKFLTFAGVQPVYLGDIDFIQNAASDIFSQLAGALMNQAPENLNAVLYGVEITHPAEFQVAWTSGAVVLNGEILKVLPGSLTSQTSRSPVLFFHVLSTLSGERTFKDGVSRECYETRTATLNETSTGGVAERTVKRLHAEKDMDYDAFWKTSDVMSCKLLQRGGLFFLDFVASIQEGQTSFDARMKFQLTSEKALPTGPINTYVGIGYETGVVPMFLGLNVLNTSGSIYEITVITYNVTAASGNARFTGMLPVY
ncbi:MAG: hypothetical protein J6M31_01835 [Bacteroidales bacterium]|nr:hypothetical protein [Bacteroidales bacterium]MBP3202329.1 hypothetical protein [Bacteroidales bacterium]